MSRHQQEPSSSRRVSTSLSHGRSWLLLAFVLVIGLTMSAIVGRLFLERRLILGPTPTLTRFPAVTDTPTADFRATINIAELITQAARRVELIGNNTPTPDVTATSVATALPVSGSAVATLPADATATRGTGFLPGISGAATSIPVQPATPTANTSGVDVETPTSQPGGATQTVVAEAAATLTAVAAAATATSTLIPTDTPPPTATSTPPPAATPTAPIVVIPLQAVTIGQVNIYAGPSVLYPLLQGVAQGQTVTLIGRTVSGEWVRVCCNGTVDGWARQAFFRITAPTPVPTTDQASRLAVVQTTAVPLRPLPVPTEIPPDDFSLFRRDQAGTGRVSTTFNLPPVRDDSFSQTALVTGGFRFSSAPVVSGSRVIAASDDGRLYNLNKSTGSQTWRSDLGTVVEFTPVLQDSNIYLVDQTGELLALIDGGNSALINWRRTTSIPPSAPLNIHGDILFMPAVDHVLYAFNRLESGNLRWATFVPEQSLVQSPIVSGYPLQHPAIGDQMIYVGDYALSALDVYSGNLVWRDSGLFGLAGPPVYSQPGVNRLAEVYAVGSNGVIHALDANTGEQIWRRSPTISSGDRPTALAVDDRRIYASGPDFVLAKDRRTGDDIWRASFNIGTLDAPIVGNGYLVVVGSRGTVLILDVNQGATLGGSSVPADLVGPPAVSAGEIFLTGDSGQMFKIR